MPTTLKAHDVSYRRDVAPRIGWYPEAASQTFNQGDFVYLVSGKVTIAASAGNLVGNIQLLGRAAADATGVTDTMIPVMIPGDNVEFHLPVYHSTPASAVTAITQVGTSYALRNQGGVWCVDIEASYSTGSHVGVRVTGIDTKYPVGEQYGVVTGRILDADQAFL